MRSWLAALQFLTVIPVCAKLDESDFQHAPFWFPVVGLLIGGMAALADTALMPLGLSPGLSSIAVIALLAAASGGLHLDGLADTGDGLLSARPRERTLEIMRDSRIGTMGVLALLVVLAVKVAALAELEGTLRWKALLFAPVSGRCLQLIVMGSLPYAREEGGLASLFIGRRRALLAVWGGVCCLSAGIAIFGSPGGAACILALLAAAALLSLWSLRRIGGFTGDTLGATSEIAEASLLLMVSLMMPASIPS